MILHAHINLSCLSNAFSDNAEVYGNGAAETIMVSSGNGA